MNIHRFARRLSPFLTAYLLLVSLGLPLHKVYCACVGKSDVSFFTGEHVCDGHADEVADILEPTACHVLWTYEVAKHAEDSKDLTPCSAAATAHHHCGSGETILAKFAGDYLFEQQTQSQLATGPAVLAAGASLLPTPITALADPIRGPAPPPLPYGRELLLRQQRFLC